VDQRSWPCYLGSIGETKNNWGQPINKLQFKPAVILCAILLAPPVRADIQFSSIGIIESQAVKKFSGTHQRGVLLRYQVNAQATSFWLPSTLDFAAGWLERCSDTALFISFGPSYRMRLNKSNLGRWFTEFGVHPTYISKTQFRGKSLGGNFFFTSYLGLGAYLDRQRKASLLLRYQHTSNAGLSNVNPGVDLLGLAFSYHFGRD